MADEPARTRLCPSCGNEVPAEANGAHDPTVPREPSPCPVCDYPLLPPPTSDSEVLRSLLRPPVDLTPVDLTPVDLTPVDLTPAEESLDEPVLSADATPTELISPPPIPAGGGVRATTGLLAKEFRQPGAAVVAVVLLLIGLGAVVGVAGLIGHGGASSRGAAALSPAPIPVSHLVDPGIIHASASSTLHPETRAYRAANTLDGSDETAWNSDGKKAGRGVGIRLQWRFDNPQHIVQITVLNGWVHSRRFSTIFNDNGRIKRVRVTTDSGSTDWSLADSPRPQTLRKDLGTTDSVRFEVLDVYPGAKYPDLALTGISFQATG